MLVTTEFALIHIPKTGGTFLSEAIKRTCEVLHEDLHCPYSEIPRDYRPLPAVAFVRNPWDWYVSWWTHHRKGRNDSNDWHYREFAIDRGVFSLSLHRTFSWGPSDYYSYVFEKLSEGTEVRRFEQLVHGFVSFLDEHEIEAPGLREAVLNSPPINTGKRGSYHDYYDGHDRQMVASSPVAVRFDYRFDDAEVEADPPERPLQPNV